MKQMDLRLESGVSHSPFYTLRRNEEETGLTQVFVYTNDARAPILSGDTINGYKEIVASPPYQESLSSRRKFSSLTVATTVPTLPGQLAYIHSSIYKKSLEFLNRGGILTGTLTAIFAMLTMMGYLSSAVGISATTALISLFSAFIIERLRLSRK